MNLFYDHVLGGNQTVYFYWYSIKAGFPCVQLRLRFASAIYVSENRNRKAISISPIRAPDFYSVLHFQIQSILTIKLFLLFLLLLLLLLNTFDILSIMLKSVPTIPGLPYILNFWGGNYAFPSDFFFHYVNVLYFFQE